MFQRLAVMPLSANSDDAGHAGPGANVGDKIEPAWRIDSDGNGIDTPERLVGRRETFLRQNTDLDAGYLDVRKRRARIRFDKTNP